MNSQLEQRSVNPLDRETVPAPASSAARAKAGSAPRAIVHGSGPHLTRETHALLRFRLRAAAFILLVGFDVFLVKHVVGVLTGEPLYPWLLGFHVLVVVVLSLLTVWLWRSAPRPQPLSPKGRGENVSQPLRVAELVIFGLPALFFLALQHRLTLADLGRGFLPAPLPFWLLLIFTHAMFIPNTWRRAALIVGVMASAPILLLAGMLRAYPDIAATMTAADFMQHVLVLAVGGIAAVFGAHLTSTLRRQAFEARQLGQYRLIELLGAGGMGEVYLAEHRMLKRPCAVKLIHPDRAGDPHVIARFEREVQMTARLSHWNTVEIFDYGRTEGGAFFYVMEHLPGLSLEELLRRHGPLPAERVVHLVRQTCAALREAHAVGLIHRDIKPGNLFAAQRGGLYDVAKLLDFGLVKPVAEIASQRLTQDGAFSGTPLFMSPEQARGLDSLDPRSDIYSLGAVAYTLLTGRPPFERATPLEVMIAHARDEAAPPSAHADVPADLEEIILRCLAKKPDDRFQDVGSLEQALSECSAADRWTQTDAARWWREHEETAAETREMSAATV